MKKHEQEQMSGGKWPSALEIVIFIIAMTIVAVITWNLVDTKITPPNEWWR
jgi:hypothetical protein